MSRFVRARTPDQKEERRQAILEAAMALYEEEGFDGVSLNGIARRAQLAKSNVYRYFESREEIFLQVLAEEWEGFVTDLERSLAPLAGRDDAALVARTLTEHAIGRPRLCQLSSVLASVLEKNLAVDTIRAFKRRMLDLSIRIGNSVHAALPALGPTDCLQLLRHFHYLLVGLWPLAHPPPAVVQVLAEPEFADFCTDFPRDLEMGLLTVIRGLMAAAN